MNKRTLTAMHGYVDRGQHRLLQEQCGICGAPIDFNSSLQGLCNNCYHEVNDDGSS